MQPQVICFGEILWDLIPSGKVAGGAPMNVAFQLNQLGISAGMVSRIGTDDSGREIFDFLKSKNIPTDWVQHDEEHPTSIVKVEIDGKGHPEYDIVQHVAWDFIAADERAVQVVQNAQALVFGSLAARSETSKNTLLALMENAPFRVLDTNLRAPFFSKKLLDELLPKAQLVKMNDDELDIIADWHGIGNVGRVQNPSDVQAKMSAIKKIFQLDVLVVTRGKDGAISLDETGFCSHLGYRVQVQDTIGSGDAFLAGYLSQFLAGNRPENCLDFACKMGAYAATKRGGTPEMNVIEFANISQSGY